MIGCSLFRVSVNPSGITYAMTSGLQEQEFEACRKQILTDRQMYDEAAKFYRR